MSPPDLSLPHHRQLFSEYLDSSEPVPNTETRESLRVPTAHYEALQVFRHDHDNASLTKVASRAYYFGYKDIKYGYDIDWETFESWYAGRVRSRGEKYRHDFVAVNGLDFSNRPTLNKYVNVYIKDRQREWLDKMKRLFGLDDYEDVLRVCIAIAIVCYDWDTWAYNRWTRFVDWAYQVRLQVDDLIEDRKERMA